MQQLEKEPDVETLTCMLQSVSEVISQGEAPAPEEGSDPTHALAVAAAAAAALMPQQQQACTQVLCKLVTESVERRTERYIASLLPFYLQYSQDANTEVRQ